jgi:hypothetical protein
VRIRGIITRDLGSRYAGLPYSSIESLMGILMSQPAQLYRMRVAQHQAILKRLQGQTCGCDHGDEDLLNRLWARLFMAWERLTDDERCVVLGVTP